MTEVVPEVNPKVPESEDRVEVRSKSLRNRVLGYLTLVALVGATGGAAYGGYQVPGGLVSSNHREHQEKIAQLEDCKKVVEANDSNHDGIARIKYGNETTPDLRVCGFANLWDYTANKITKRHNLLDSWVPYFNISGEVQLPSTQALDQAVKDENHQAYMYAFNRRSGAAGAGAAVGFVGFLAAGLSAIVISDKFRNRKTAAKIDLNDSPEVYEPEPWDFPTAPAVSLANGIHDQAN